MEKNKLALPFGVSNYKKPSYYYVDKTLLIRDLLSLITEVTLVNRPRRFGKSLNLDTKAEDLASKDLNQIRENDYLEDMREVYTYGGPSIRKKVEVL